MGMKKTLKKSYIEPNLFGGGKRKRKTFTKSKPPCCARGKFKTPDYFEEQIINAYTYSGLGINNISISVGNRNRIPDYLKFKEGNLRNINNYIRNTIGNLIVDRMQEPIYDILRLVEDVC